MWSKVRALSSVMPGTDLPALSFLATPCQHSSVKSPFQISALDLVLKVGQTTRFTVLKSFVVSLLSALFFLGEVMGNGFYVNLPPLITASRALCPGLVAKSTVMDQRRLPRTQEAKGTVHGRSLAILGVAH